MPSHDLARSVVAEAEALFAFAETVVPKLEAEIAGLRLKILNADGGYAVRFGQVRPAPTFAATSPFVRRRCRFLRSSARIVSQAKAESVRLARRWEEDKVGAAASQRSRQRQRSLFLPLSLVTVHWPERKTIPL